MGERRGMALVYMCPPRPRVGGGVALLHIDVESNGELARRLASAGRQRPESRERKLPERLGFHSLKAFAKPPV
jgi:hypothetical protein